MSIELELARLFTMEADAGDTPEGDGGSTAVAPPETEQAPAKEKASAPPKERTAPGERKPKPMPQYAVILENDDDHTYEYVIEVLQRVVRVNVEQAYLFARQVDLTGEAVVWTGNKEVAELKRDQIKGYGPDFYASRTVRYPLGVRIEPMPG